MSDGDAATAFAPGHVTGFFSVERTETPERTGSRGAGITLSAGVTTRVEPSDETRVRLNGREVAVESVTRVLDALDATAAVSAETELPLGAGFGVSGAMALGTALAANSAFDAGLSVNDLVSVAHAAEVEAGTGLGDVVAQARGGVPIRVKPGAPAHGRLDGVPDAGRVEYVSFGGLSTSDVIGGDTATLSAAGEDALAALREHPTLPRFMALSREFSREAGLLDGDVEAAVEAVTDAGGEAAMAMLGETVFALGTGLSDAGYDPEVCRVHPAGATLDP
ncbi:pantoate kinase [Halobacterium hubeiense]|uniref:Pantoate kinase n=1 Tax=Halobacterium hubeiense TaxID=1407499 RepID=A0A0U5H1D5_9EURY|nr:pantoate kinase [Halobacterium hubeiense]CQH48338.1 pantoate kinase [Halobacterium hubeiense]